MGCLSTSLPLCIYPVYGQMTTVDGITLLEEKIATYHKETTQLITQTRTELKESEGRVLFVCMYLVMECEIVACVKLAVIQSL